MKPMQRKMVECRYIHKDGNKETCTHPQGKLQKMAMCCVVDDSDDGGLCQYFEEPEAEGPNPETVAKVQKAFAVIGITLTVLGILGLAAINY